MQSARDCWWACSVCHLIVTVLYLLRYQILSSVEARIGLGLPTAWAAQLLSTPAFRVGSLVLLATGFVLCLVAAKVVHKLIPVTVLGLAAVLIVGWARMVGTPVGLALPALLILATNLTPLGVPSKLLGPRLWNSALALGAGIAEVLFFRHYLQWLRGAPPPVDRERWGALSTTGFIPAALLAGMYAVVVMKNGTLAVDAEYMLRASATFRRVAYGDFNWIELDPTGRYLYATGHGFPRLLRYDTDDWSVPPREADVETGRAQSFAYDMRRGELYVFNARSDQLMYFSPELKLTRSVSVPDVSPGDAMIVVDPISVSERARRTQGPWRGHVRVPATLLA